MPFPTIGSFPQNTYSMALVRWDVATGVGTFIGRIGETGFHVEALPAGTYRYETWLVQGYNNLAGPTNGTNTYRVVYNGKAKLVVQHAKR